jgi:hypothetical protein
MVEEGPSKAFVNGLTPALLVGVAALAAGAPLTKRLGPEGW